MTALLIFVVSLAVVVVVSTIIHYATRSTTKPVKQVMAEARQISQRPVPPRKASAPKRIDAETLAALNKQSKARGGSGGYRSATRSTSSGTSYDPTPGYIASTYSSSYSSSSDCGSSSSSSSYDGGSSSSSCDSGGSF